MSCKAALLLLIIVSFTSCSYSVTLTHTQGFASDIVDQNQETSADIEPNLEIP